MDNGERDLKGIGERIFLARDRKGLTQRGLADALGVRPSHMSRWENGRVAPRSGVLVEVARLCGVSLEWLLTGTGRPEQLHVMEQAEDYEGREPMYMTSRGWQSRSRLCADAGIEACKFDQWLAATDDTVSLVRLPVWVPFGASGPRGLASAAQAGHVVVSAEMAGPDIVALKIASDAMSPTVVPGAVVGVDASERTISSAGIYAVWTAQEGVVLRRVFAEPGKVVLRADNQIYPSVEFRSQKAIRDAVMGRMRWSIQSI